MTTVAAPGPVLEHRFRAMNTDVHVIVVGGHRHHLMAAETAVNEREDRWSRFRPRSELSLLNCCPGRPVVVSADTFALIADAVEAHHLTDGAFDPTVLACMEAAGYDRSFDLLQPAPGSSAEPAPGPAPAQAPAPGPDGIEFHPATSAIVLPSGVGLDLGGIAKGAAADAVAAEILAAGAAGCCVNLGGDLRLVGQPPTADGWLVELACPGATSRRTIALAEGAVCTSAVGRRRWWGPGGTPEHHLRHPQSGAPLHTGLAAVSIVAATAIQAEVLTKVAFGAGATDATQRLAPYGVTGVLVLDNGEVIELPGLDPFAAGAARQAQQAQQARQAQRL